jgi:hypothetical protein
VEPEAVEPEAVEPEAVEPEAVEPEAVEPEAVEPEAVEPEAGEPEAGQPEAVQPEAAEPDAAAPEPEPPTEGEPGGRLPQQTGTVRGISRALRRRVRAQPEAGTSQRYEKPAIARAPGPSGSDARGSPEWCTIKFLSVEGRGEFQVVVLEPDGRRRVAERSSNFRVPRSLKIRNHGAPRAAHGALVEQLLAAGWRPLAVRGRWHDTAFVRYRRETREVKRLAISCGQEGQTARFYAGDLDDFGHGTSVAQSASFAAQMNGSVLAPTDEAMRSHQSLMKQLCLMGWTPTETGRPEWYSRVLEKSED